MAAESEKTTTIQSVWAQRCAEDLAVNREKQSNITAQISDLQEQLAQLQQDEAWLVERQKSLALPAAPGDQTADAQQPAGKADENTAWGEDTLASSVPQPRQEEGRPAGRKAATKVVTAEKSTGKAVAAKKATGKKSPGKKAATQQATAQKAAAPKAAAKATAAKKKVPAQADTPKQQPLQTLVLAIVSKAPVEPRLAREVYDELAKQHPDRATSVQTVRNTLEALVKKQSIDKSNQQGSVMYCAKKSGPDAFTADSRTAQPDEKAPAQV
ncbi:hypothetical protein JK359_16400 [Streptomyces actinomycinicus]|uniref:Uncharacterized protein n=1 Tax=Streptomyces actinomycinicus TaxID=1695166 RepID=A0A937EK02_9ACTN|nr:hypothetical protein [Streptomyces actinomycinicus]MBL1083536.1 hypothetical protein [Streptomyces actinomycinicus]